MRCIFGGHQDSFDDFRSPELVVHSFSDAKLKGFGAVALLQSTAEHKPEYRLFCGKGIRTIHIW
jgi:hypothetical protein